MLFIFLFTSPSAEASLIRWVPSANTSIDEQNSMQVFISTTLKLLPRKMHPSQKVHVVFKKLDAYNEVQNPCGRNNQKKASTPVFAEWTNKQGYHEIALHSGFKKDILIGPQKSTTINCEFGTFYRMAQASLLHELGHIWDNNTTKRMRTLRHEHLQKCAVKKSRHDHPESLYCHLPNFMERRISSDPQFLHLTNWKWRHRRFFRKNLKTSTSPRAYERKNPQETFAVNLEYFLLDPDFKCHRPALYNYFKQKLEHTPFKQSRCQTNYSLPSYNGLFIYNIDPKKVDSIHFVLAGEGRSFVSKWGHAMYRIVTCDTPGNCLQKPSQNFIVSFAAQSQNLLLGTWEGFRASYSSQIFIKPFLEVINDYRIDNMRDVTSYPLNLSPKEKEQLIHVILERYWDYQGRYSLFTNNCSVESQSMLAAAVNEKSLAFFDWQLFSPIDMKNQLLQTSYINQEPLKDIKKAIEKGYFFPSIAQNSLEKWKSIQSYFSNPSIDSEKELYQHLNELTFDEIKIIADELTKHGTVKQIGQFFLLLTILESSVMSENQEKISQRLYNMSNQLLFEYSNILFPEPDYWRNETGYGVPLILDLSSIPERQDPNSSLSLKAKEFQIDCCGDLLNQINSWNEKMSEVKSLLFKELRNRRKQHQNEN